jgi:hypothetical protein
LAWHHFPGGTGSWIVTHLDDGPFWNHGSTHHGLRQEMDPFGADVGYSSPIDPPPLYNERGSYLYIEGGDPFDYSGGCTLDGLPISCNQLLHKIDVGAVQAVGPNGIPGDVIHKG